MNSSDWFSYQLKASGDGLVWAIEQIPLERRTLTPPEVLGEWTATRHVFHLYYYERDLVLPHMLHWLGRPLPSFHGYDEDNAWLRVANVESLLTEFQQVRELQIALLPRFNEVLWNEVRQCEWGEVSMKWIVTKTYQHTADHINTILSMALFWDMYLPR